VCVPDVVKREIAKGAVVGGFENVLERRAVNFFSDLVLIIVRGDDMHVDGDVWDFDHEVGHAEDAAVDARGAFDLEHLGRVAKSSRVQ